VTYRSSVPQVVLDRDIGTVWRLSHTYQESKTRSVQLWSYFLSWNK